MDFTQYVKNDDVQEETLKKEEPAVNTGKEEEPVQVINMKEMMVICNRLSGTDADGNSKGIVQYQTYAMDDPETKKSMIYSAKNARVGISAEPNLPGFFVVDLMFRSADDTELKMLWGRIQKFFQDRIKHPDKDFVFYFNILERASVSIQTSVNDRLMVLNVFNPLTAYLTREVPNLLAEEHVMRVQTGEAELCGGNILRMVCSSELFSIQQIADINTSEIKGEVMRENDAAMFLNNEENNNQWSE